MGLVRNVVAQRRFTGVQHFQCLESSVSAIILSSSALKHGYIDEARTRKERNPNNSGGTPDTGAGRNEELRAKSTRPHSGNANEASLKTGFV
jgi:hypothetical protein